jgi:hypothetical protein
VPPALLALLRDCLPLPLPVVTVFIYFVEFIKIVVVLIFLFFFLFFYFYLFIYLFLFYYLLFLIIIIIIIIIVFIFIYLFIYFSYIFFTSVFAAEGSGTSEGYHRDTTGSILKGQLAYHEIVSIDDSQSGITSRYSAERQEPKPEARGCGFRL